MATGAGLRNYPAYNMNSLFFVTLTYVGHSSVNEHNVGTCRYSHQPSWSVRLPGRPRAHIQGRCINKCSIHVLPSCFGDYTLNLNIDFHE